MLQSYKSQLRTYQQWSCVTVGSREAQPGRWPRVTILHQRSAYETQVSSQKTSNVSLKEKRSNTADRACQEEKFSLMPTARNNQWHNSLDEIPLLKAHKNLNRILHFQVNCSHLFMHVILLSSSCLNKVINITQKGNISSEATDNMQVCNSVLVLPCEI